MVRKKRMAMDSFPLMEKNLFNTTIQTQLFQAILFQMY